MNSLGKNRRTTPTTRAAVTAGATALLTTLGCVLTASPATAETTPAATASTARITTLVQGPWFSSPGSKVHESNTVALIDGAPKDSTIRVATMSFTSTTFSRAFVRAAKRGVKVRILTAGKARTSTAFKETRAGFRAHRGSGSRIKAVRFSARGDSVVNGRKTVFHQKSLTFSRTLGRDQVTVISSANLTDEARDNQWTDSYAFVENRAIRKRMDRVYRQQWRDKPLANPFQQFTPPGGTAQLTFGPWNSPTMKDPVLSRIRSVPGAKGTTIRVANAAWHGPRGIRLAKALARKARRGAKVFVLVGRPFAPEVRQVLRRAGATFLIGHVPGKQYQHVKFMTARYRDGSKVRMRVWAGSENWSADATAADELVFRVSAGRTYRGYVRFFDQINREALALAGRG